MSKIDSRPTFLHTLSLSRVLSSPLFSELSIYIERLQSSTIHRFYLPSSNIVHLYRSGFDSFRDTFTQDAMELDWSPDYCLACDKQTSGGAYCCQSCRLADVETASEPVSPTSTTGKRDSGLHLEPAFNFAAHRSPPLSPAPSKYLQQSQQPKSYFSNQPTSPQEASSGRALTPSSSRSSLGSVASLSSSDCQLSAQARTELRGYTNSFDSIRNWRRQMTTP